MLLFLLFLELQPAQRGGDVKVRLGRTRIHPTDPGFNRGRAVDVPAQRVFTVNQLDRPAAAVMAEFGAEEAGSNL